MATKTVTITQPVVTAPDDKVHVLKHAILMSQGIWNDRYYSADEIKQAYENTDWNDKTNRNLFLDHQDQRASEWVGEVNNPSYEGDTLYGDLIVIDPTWVHNLKYGKPKVGISPSLKGREDKKNKSVKDFTFRNFSVVINPAVKTAYLNNWEDLKVEEKSVKEVLQDEAPEEESPEVEEKNAEVTAFEATRKKMGLSPSQFYAIPRDPPSASKLPIYDAAHTRNAMARFNQVKGVSSAERATAKRKIMAAAKKFGINVRAFEKLNEAYSLLYEKNENQEVKETMEDMADLFELLELKGISVSKALGLAKDFQKKEEGLSDREAVRRAGVKLQEEKEEEEKKEEEAPKEEPPKEEPKPEAEEPPKEEAPKEEEKPAEETPPEAEAKMKALEEKVKKLSEKLNEPDTLNLAKVDKELVDEDPILKADRGMLKYLSQRLEEGF